LLEQIGGPVVSPPHVPITARGEPAMIHDLWDQLCGFSPCQIEDALAYLFDSLGTLVQADNLLWVATVRIVDGSRPGLDVGHGWRIHAAQAWRRSPTSAAPRKASLPRRTKETENFTGLISPAVTHGSGQFRVHGLHDREGQTVTRAIVRGDGGQVPQVHDRLWVVFPVSADTESYFILDKTSPGSRFSARDHAMAAYTLRGIKWFHRQLLLGHGLVATDRPLTTTERRVMRLLLTDQSEKEIARSLGLGFDTTHKCVGKIYRNFRVRSRTGLMALWLGGRE
jgi:DNA-binding CsgD family transcriptional regulator